MTSRSTDAWLLPVRHLVRLVRVVVLWTSLASAAGRVDAGEASVAVRRTDAPVQVDGVLSEDAWRTADPVTTWYETDPGNNTVPPIGNRAYFIYDASALYVGFEFRDPAPQDIRAPIGDRDTISPEMDYAGIILDPGNSGRTAIELFVNAAGVQSDAVADDASGEDFSPDFFWDAATRVTSTGWTLEVRVPFSSLSYARGAARAWRVMLLRNYARDFRYQFCSSPLPRGSNCFICHARPLVGLSDLPQGGGIVIAPYVSATYDGVRGGSADASPRRHALSLGAGFDAKWRPNAGTVVDLTVKPDFSQVEADVAQIATNERFALFYPEKRPFFLEGAELFSTGAASLDSAVGPSTPLQPVHTRTLTSPEWGVRGTGKLGALAFTGLVVQDAGGGSVVIPGSAGSRLAEQDFDSWAGIWRLRYGSERAVVGALATTREVFGGGYNFLAGPDFQWRPSASESLQGQLLMSVTRTPDRPDLDREWDARRLWGHASELEWAHTTESFDWSASVRDVAKGFRAYNGFIPQVDYREAYAEAGYTLRPEAGAIRKWRLFASYDRSLSREWDFLFQELALGVSVEGRWTSAASLEYAFDRVLVDGAILPRHQLVFDVSSSPSRVISQVALTGATGMLVDFENARRGLGADLAVSVTLRVTPHLELVLDDGLRTLHVRSPAAEGSQLRWLFTAQVHRLRATYTFTPRFFVRALVQYEDTHRATNLYATETTAKDAALLGSLLIAYKLNWQSVLFLGYGDNRSWSTVSNSLEPTTRQLFVKASYAVQ
jgi:hypothetical protein